MEDLVNRGYIADWKIPTFDRMPPAMRMKTSAYTAYMVVENIAYNTNKVTEDEAKLLASDWNAILDPRFKGRIALTNQKCGACYSVIHMFLDPKYKDRFGEKLLRGLAAQKPKIYGDTAIPVDRVIAG